MRRKDLQHGKEDNGREIPEWYVPRDSIVRCTITKENILYKRIKEL